MKVLLINPGLPHTLAQLEFMVDAGIPVEKELPAAKG